MIKTFKKMMKIFQKYMLHINNLILFFKILFWVIAEFYDKKIEFFGYVTWRFWVLDRCAHDTGVYDHHVTIENLKTVILGQIRKEFKMSSNKPVVEKFWKKLKTSVWTSVWSNLAYPIGSLISNHPAVCRTWTWKS